MAYGLVPAPNRAWIRPTCLSRREESGPVPSSRPKTSVFLTKPNLPNYPLEMSLWLGGLNVADQHSAPDLNCPCPQMGGIFLHFNLRMISFS